MQGLILYLCIFKYFWISVCAGMTVIGLFAILSKMKSRHQGGIDANPRGLYVEALTTLIA